ncbi:MAG TPA: PilZ domain-containing protein [Kiloniellales bacterium]|nr:PilZ domain-containing protein [Kiloniellales bacterium]
MSGEPENLEATEEFRGSHRALVMHPAVIRAGEQEVTCQILSISTSGAKLRPIAAVPEASAVELLVADVGEYRCAVEWQDEEFIGVRFLDDPEVVERLCRGILANPESGEGSRRATRVQVLWSGRLVTREKEIGCRVVNVSLTGVKVHMSDRTLMPSPVTLRIARFGDFPCEIIWREGEYLGLSFFDDRKRIEETIGVAVPLILQGND